jgi:hypothetical protein
MKRFIGLLFIGFMAIELIGQTTQQNLEKYWHYRYRLVNYFLKVGGDPGESLPIGIRNRFMADPIFQRGLDIGDCPRYLGHYIGMLATEYALLKMNNQDLNEIKRELYYALNAVIRLDVNAETNVGLPGNLDGCVARDDMPLNFLTTHEMNYQLTDCSNPSVCLQVPGSGQPGYVTGIDKNGLNSVISQDHFSQMLVGFALVKKLVDPGTLTFSEIDDNNNHIVISADLVQMAISTVNRIILFAQDGADVLVTQEPPTYTHLKWWYKDANGDYVTNQWGGDWRPFAPGFAKAAQYITGVDYSDNVTNTEGYWQTSQEWEGLRLNNSNLLIALGLAAVSDYWRDEDGNNTTLESIKYQGDYDAGTYMSQNYAANHYGWDLYFGAIYNILHDKPFNLADICKMQQILNSAPFNGPFSHNSGDVAPGDWAATYRFNGSPPHQTTGDPEGGYYFGGNFFGLDYMFFHNLYYLAHASPTTTTYSGTYPNQIVMNTLWIGDQDAPLMIPSQNHWAEIIFDNFQLQVVPGHTGTMYVDGSYRGVTLSNNVNFEPGTFVDIEINPSSCISMPGEYIFNYNYYDRVASYQEIQYNPTANSIVDLFPNPNAGSMVVNFAISNDASLLITDITGKHVCSYKLPASESSMNISCEKLENGVYLYYVIEGEKVIKSDKLVIIK